MKPRISHASHIFLNLSGRTFMPSILFWFVSAPFQPDGQIQWSRGQMCTTEAIDGRESKQFAFEQELSKHDMFSVHLNNILSDCHRLHCQSTTALLERLYQTLAVYPL